MKRIGLVLQAIELLLCQAGVGNDLIVGYSVEKHGFCHFLDTLQDTLPDTFLDTFLHTFFVSVIEQGSLHSDVVECLVVCPKLGIGECRDFQFSQSLVDFGILCEFLWHLIGARIDFREEAKPEHCHALLQHGLGLELRQLDEGEVQTIDYLLAVLVVYDLVVVDEGISKKKKEKILARTRTYYVLYKIYSMYIDTIWYYGF